MRMTLKENTYEPIPKGTYQFTVKDCKEQKKKNSTDVFISWTFQVSEDTEYNERLVSFATPVNSLTAKYKEFLIACGVPEDINWKEEFDIETSEFLGKEFIGTVKIDKTTSGTPINKFESFKSLEEYQQEIEKARAKFSLNASAKASVTKKTEEVSKDDSSESSEQTEEVKDEPHVAAKPAEKLGKPVTVRLKADKPAGSVPKSSGKSFEFPE